ncbi:MAG: hypothetical protein FJ217_16435 [Ignavibacteria bacterium]|nr:hypothetical protein [Ignavibacteria bacterium]
MSLSPGTVFTFVNPDFPDNPPHPKIAVAVSPDKRVVYVYTSTREKSVRAWCEKIEGKSGRGDLRTLVSAPITECPVLRQDSWINCNNADMKDEDVLRRRPAFCEYTGGKASMELVGRIRVGVLSSPKVPETIKKVIREQQWPPRAH